MAKTPRCRLYRRCRRRDRRYCPHEICVVRHVKDEAGMVAAHAVDHPAATGSAIAVVGLLGLAIGYISHVVRLPRPTLVSLGGVRLSRNTRRSRNCGAAQPLVP